jgi:hypothetical protein
MSDEGERDDRVAAPVRVGWGHNRVTTVRAGRRWWRDYHCPVTFSRLFPRVCVLPSGRLLLCFNGPLNPIFSARVIQRSSGRNLHCGVEG